MVRAGRLEYRVNILAIAGAFLSYVSLLTAWAIVERGYDWTGSVSYSLFLLLTYPVSVVTPLASIGQAGVLIYSAAYASVELADIEPFYGYLIAWVAVGFMLAGVARPRLSLRTGAKPEFVETVLTVTARRAPRT